MNDDSSSGGNVVVISGMFGAGKTFFANSPVVIDISGLEWPSDSPFNIVRVEVLKANSSDQPGDIAGTFRADTGGQTEISFDISSALRTIWSDVDFDAELAKAHDVLDSEVELTALRAARRYFLRVYTEYMASDDDGVFTETQCAVVIGGTEYTDIPGGRCVLGRWTEWERSLITDVADATVATLNHKGLRYGDASTKPTSTPERVGKNSITSWVNVENDYTRSIFFPADMTPEEDDPANAQPGKKRYDRKIVYTGHAPLVVRDSQPYVDFLFVNRRGAVETCSALMLEAMDIGVDTTTYTRTERPSFQPKRSLDAISEGDRHSWSMSSGHQTRDWAEWWTSEFLMSKRKWMRCSTKGKPSATGTIFAPVVVKPAKNSVTIYDRTKQQMPSVEFTVTLGLEG